MKTYRALQLLTNEVNFLISEYALPISGNVMIGLSVVANIVIIRFHDRLELEILFLFVVGSGTGNIYLLASYIVLGEVNEISKVAILSTIRKTGGNTKETIVFKKYLNSCRLYFRIHLSYFGYYRKSISIRIIGKLVVYTVRLLILSHGFE